MIMEAWLYFVAYFCVMLAVAIYGYLIMRGKV